MLNILWVMKRHSLCHRIIRTRQQRHCRRTAQVPSPMGIHLLQRAVLPPFDQEYQLKLHIKLVHMLLLVLRCARLPLLPCSRLHITVITRPRRHLSPLV